MKTKVIQKNIRFPIHVVKILEEEGKKFGMTFNEYIKYLAIKKFEEILLRKGLSE